MPATGGHQLAGARVTLAVKTFAAHLARPVDVQARVEAWVEVEAEVGVQARAQVAVWVEVPVQVQVQVQIVGARRSAVRVRGVLFLTKRACRPRPRPWPAPGCERKA